VADCQLDKVGAQTLRLEHLLPRTRPDEETLDSTADTAAGMATDGSDSDDDDDVKHQVGVSRDSLLHLVSLYMSVGKNSQAQCT
jgi:hypothetical protein